MDEFPEHGVWICALCDYGETNEFREDREWEYPVELEANAGPLGARMAYPLGELRAQYTPIRWNEPDLLEDAIRTRLNVTQDIT